MLTKVLVPGNSCINGLRLRRNFTTHAGSVAINAGDVQKQKGKSRRLTTAGTGLKIKAVNGRTSFLFDLTSLQRYYGLYGTTMVPHKFSFKRDELDSGHSGSYIGAQVNNLRAYAKIDPKCVPVELKQALDNMGFVWDVPKHRLELALKGVLTYKSIFGHEIIPQKFVVPHDDLRWDRTLWGLKLGARFLNIKRQHRSAADNRKKVFEAAGLDVQLNRAIKAEIFVEGLQLYKTLYVLPQHIQEHTHIDVDIQLGATTHHTTGADDASVVSPTNNGTSADSVQFSVPSSFVFPTDHPDIPDRLKGYDLGSRVRKLKRGDFKQVREAIINTGLSGDYFL